MTNIRLLTLFTLSISYVLLSAGLSYASPRTAGGQNTQTKSTPEKPPQNAARTESPLEQTEQEQKEEEEESEPEAKSPVLFKANIDKIESIGFYSSPQDGSLGRDLWNKTQRSAAMDLIPLLPHPGDSPPLQSLIYGALLSKTNAGLIQDDISPKPGQDLFTIRLFKLMNLGLSDKALEMYSSLGGPAYHPNLARAGIIAILLNGEKSLACLEYKTYEDRNFTGTFWTDIDQYCRYILEDTKPTAAELKTITSKALRRILAGGSYTFTYTPEKMNAIPLFDKGILVAEQIINFGNLNTLQNTKAVAPEHILLAMKSGKLSEEARFYLEMRAVGLGIKSFVEWRDTYQNMKFNSASYTNKDINLEALPHWQRLPALYQNTQNKRGDERHALILTALDYESSYGITALLPFSNMFARLPTHNLSTTKLKQLVRVLHKSDTPIPAEWFDTVKYKDLSGAKDAALYTLLYLAKTSRQQSAQADREKITSILDTVKNSTLKENYRIIIENVDKDWKTPHNPDKVYENDLDLTLGNSYVMPSIRVWDRLLISSQNQSIGETVLLSSVVLNGKSLSKLYPGLLSDVLQSLRSVGLTRFSESLARQALVENL